MTAEVAIDNKDIGFVNAGDRRADQAGDLSLHALRHGRGPGEERDGRCGERREARGHLPGDADARRKSIDVDGKRISLSPGMNVTAEIKTGKRRVIEYLLSPVQRALRQSLGER